MSDDPISTSGFTMSDETVSNDRFTDFQNLPSGGFNCLMRAKRNGQWWVLKGLKAQYRDDVAYQHLLQKEYDIMSRLSHPNIVNVSGMEDVEGVGRCIVMEWVDGTTLREWLKVKHSAKSRRYIIHQLMDALEYIHVRQSVHRDLKPSNIMLTRNGQHVKLIDFGLADTDNYAIFKQSCGTEGYVAPEQAADGKSDLRNDIYSLGRIIRDMRPGWLYRKVAQHCMLPIGRRPKSISAVRANIVRFRRLQVLVLSLMIASVTICAGLWTYEKAFVQKIHYDVVTSFQIGNIQYKSWGGGLVAMCVARDGDACVEIPHTVKYQGATYQVKEISFDAFKKCRLMRTAVLPNGEIQIMRGAFSHNKALQKIVCRSNVPPTIGNKYWPCGIADVFTDEQFRHVTVVVPQGALQAYRSSAWDKFVHIEEMS